ncbi:MAG: metalloprotease PmbA [Chromatiales bacterium]|nr:metalloprotease PmbA [Chromatiales bacterium]
MSESRQRGVEELNSVIAEALALASRLGASQAEASASAGTGLSVTVRKREVETLEHHQDQGLGVTVYLGQKKGSASTSDLRPAAVEETVRKALSLARFGAEDAAAGLADPERLATDIPDLHLYHPWAVTPAGAIEIATRCEAAALDTDPRIDNSEGASLSTYAGSRCYGNSHGFLAGYRDSQHSLSCAVIARAGAQMERDYEYTVARDPAGLEDAEAVGREAGRRTVARLGSVKLGTRKVPVLFPARLARGLVGHLVGAISGGSIYRRSSFLVDSIDTQLFPEWLRIDELPHLHGGQSSAAYDEEGVATRDRVLVEDGVLRGYMLGSYYARKLGLQSTGNAGGAHNLVVNDTGQDFDGLLREMGSGLLVTELMGHGVNAVTGDYSRGAAGFWVEQGKLAYPVSEITIAGNLRDMYRQIIAVGNDVDRRGGVLCGSVLLEQMTLAGS